VVRTSTCGTSGGVAVVPGWWRVVMALM
jgi:hypothetical protein